jgi:DNA integrity scanning protein DisA with diadenylate cyclase activity
MSDFNLVIDVLDKAMAMLVQLKDDASLIETNHEQVWQLGKDLEGNLKDFKHRRVLYQPFVEALMQMASEKFADQDMVMKVIKYMQALRAELDAGRIALQNGYESLRSANQAIVDEYVQKIRILEEVVIPMLQEDIETTTGEIRTKQGLLSDANANLAEA